MRMHYRWFYKNVLKITLITIIQTMFEENSRKTDSLHRDQKPRTRNKSAELAINPEAGIINLLRQGFFALQLLPENSSAGTELVLAYCHEKIYPAIVVIPCVICTCRFYSQIPLLRPNGKTTYMYVLTIFSHKNSKMNCFSNCGKI